MNKIKIGVLTSSRADYGIYKPLLDQIKNDSRFDLTIISFGMHLQEQHGSTIKEIEADNYSKIAKINGMPFGDSRLQITEGYGELIKSFANYWEENNFDWVLALGDRFEMSAAVQAGIPFEANFVHLHGGETTLGAIDNIYRHQISLASKIHFTATQDFSDRLKMLLADPSAIISNVGALSLCGLEDLELPNWDDVCKKFSIPNEEFCLITFHPETVGLDKNIEYVRILKEALSELCNSIHLIITLANADSLGSLYRSMAQELKLVNKNKISLIESFGKINYFSAMKNCNYLLGNTSSGILEAASFGKYVINVGNRQLGRIQSANIIDVQFIKESILLESKKIIGGKKFSGVNRYEGANTVQLIIDKLIENSH